MAAPITPASRDPLALGDGKHPLGTISLEGALAGHDEETVPILSNQARAYRRISLAIWLSVSAMMVLDRFYWNAWPRQTMCSADCGDDFFCDLDEDPGCLRKGPWSVKAFDVIARTSGRLIISTTNLLFITVSHSTWNRLSEVSFLRPYLYAWRDDNVWLHNIGGWAMGASVIVHVWSLLLPPIFDGYSSRVESGPFEWLFQVTLETDNVSVEREEVVWGVDDVWRIVWMTIIFGLLMPLSRSAWALAQNFPLAMWLHTALGIAVFFDSWRRKTHPHVWILNTPFFLWYLGDKMWCLTRGRVNDCTGATRVLLDDQYMILTWKHEGELGMICDSFRLRGVQSDGKQSCIAGEIAPLCMTYLSYEDPSENYISKEPLENRQVTPDVEGSGKAQPAGSEHRFSLTTTASERFSNISPGQSSPGSSLLSNAYRCRGASSRSVLGREESADMIGESRCSSGTSLRNTINLIVRGLQTPGAHYPKRCVFIEKEEKDDSGATVDVNASETAREIAGVADSESMKSCNRPIATSRGDCRNKERAKRSSSLRERIQAIRVPNKATQTVGERKDQSLPGGTWSRVAILKVYRDEEKHPSSVGCAGFPWISRAFTERGTSSIKDVELAEQSARFSLRTFGPYRSGYGRLGEFPRLPPLVIIATGAGALLALDFIGYVRAHKLVAARPVNVFYTSTSTALLHFVANLLMAEDIPGIRIEAALSRQVNPEAPDVAGDHEEGLPARCLDVEGIIRRACVYSEVYFCGDQGTNNKLRKACAKRGMEYVGKSVD